MKETILQWWPTLPALLIVYLGGSSFIDKYPVTPERREDRIAGSGSPDSLLAYVRAGMIREAAKMESDSAGDIEPGNPFRPIKAPRPSGRGAPAARAEPPPRRYVLKGTVGINVATIANNSGQKLIVKVGDRIDSAEVLSIELNKVILKDRGGKFELLLEK
ncbi:MAG: hypothetical protein M3Y08_09015 [Fibrobacterota bacterium]|nr:hypothetical protein [Fibrobacterota bacterium]